MSITVLDTYWVCLDCRDTIEFGYSEGLDEDQQEAIEYCIRKETNKGKNQFVSDNGDNDEGYEEFTWRHCECCGSQLGGTRHRYNLIGEPS